MAKLEPTYVSTAHLPLTQGNTLLFAVFLCQWNFTCLLALSCLLPQAQSHLPMIKILSSFDVDILLEI